MKKQLLLLAIPFLFIGCTQNTVTKEDCLKEGKVLKSTKKLNYRTGDYEYKYVCVKKG